MRRIGRSPAFAILTLACLLVGCGGGGGQTVTVESVELASDLVSGAVTVPKGTKIDLTGISGGKVADPHPPACTDRHLHAEDPARGIDIWFTAPLARNVTFLDPDPNGCGYGKIVIRTIPEIDDSGGLAQRRLR